MTNQSTSGQPAPRQAAAVVTFVGHATVLIEMEGVRLLTDPLLRSFIGPLRRQEPLPGDDIQQIDAVLISHLHGDHFDVASLKKLGRDTPLIVPEGAGQYLREKHFTDVIELAQGESIKRERIERACNAG